MNYKNRDLFNLVNDSFLYSSFFINSFDSSVILYPQSFFEYNYFSYFLSNSFNISNVFNFIFFDKVKYFSLISSLQNVYSSLFFNNFAYLSNLSNSLILFIKLLFFRIFKNRRIFNYLVFFKYKLNIKVILYYLNVIFPNNFIFQLPLKFILNSSIKPNVTFFKNLNNSNITNKLLLFKFFLSSINKFKHNIPSICKKTGTLMSSVSSDLSINTLNWIFYYLKERKNFIFNSKLLSKLANFNSIVTNKLFYNYSLSNLFERNDFLFKTF